MGHYTLDVKMAQLTDRVSRLDGKIGDTEDAMEQVSLLSKENRKEVGRLEGKKCQCPSPPFSFSESSFQAVQNKSQ